MDFVAEEMIGGFPLAVFLEFSGRNVVEINKRSVQLFRHGFNPWGEGCEFAVHLVGVALLVCLAWSECEQNRCGTFSPDFINETAHISSKCIDGLHTAVLFDGHHRGVLNQVLVVRSAIAFGAFIAGTRPVLINWAVVVVSQFEHHIVA